MCEQKTHLKALHSMPETDIINVRFLLSTASSTKLKYASSKNKIGFYSVRWHSIVTFLFCLFILNFLKLIVCYWPCFLKLLNLKSILILRHIEISIYAIPFLMDVICLLFSLSCLPVTGFHLANYDISVHNCSSSEIEIHRAVLKRGPLQRPTKHIQIVRG